MDIPSDISSIADDRAITVFLWEECGDCIAEYDSYSTLVSLYDDQGIDIVFVWKDNIPEDVDNLGFGSAKHFYMSDMKAYVSWVPTYFTLSADKTIEGVTTDIEVVEEYLSDKFQANEEEPKKRIDSRVIMFSLEGCKGCDYALQQINGTSNANCASTKHWCLKESTETKYEDTCFDVNGNFSKFQYSMGGWSKVGSLNCPN